jgi:hypothetical protein
MRTRGRAQYGGEASFRGMGRRGAAGARGAAGDTYPPQQGVGCLLGGVALARRFAAPRHGSAPAPPRGGGDRRRPGSRWAGIASRREAAMAAMPDHEEGRLDRGDPGVERVCIDLRMGTVDRQHQQREAAGT